MPWVNEGAWDRVLRCAVGASLLALGLGIPSVLSDLLDVLGGLLVLTGITGYSWFCTGARVMHPSLAKSNGVR